MQFRRDSRWSHGGQQFLSGELRRRVAPRRVGAKTRVKERQPQREREREREGEREGTGNTVKVRRNDAIRKREGGVVIFHEARHVASYARPSPLLI